jgi:hypothetical protein
MRLFELVEGVVMPVPELIGLKAFAELASEKNVNQHLTFIFHANSWESPYAVYGENRRVKAMEDVYGKQVVLPKKVLDAEQKYIELMQTDSVMLLESARNAVRKLREYFDDVDLIDSKEPGKAGQQLVSNLKSVAGVIESLKALEEQVRKERDENAPIRKGVQINEFNS